MNDTSAQASPEPPFGMKMLLQPSPCETQRSLYKPFFEEKGTYAALVRSTYATSAVSLGYIARSDDGQQARVKYLVRTNSGSQGASNKKTCVYGFSCTHCIATSMGGKTDAGTRRAWTTANCQPGQQFRNWKGVNAPKIPEY